MDDNKPTFDTATDFETGRVADLSPLIRRIVAGNEGPMTFKGTCTYVVGRGDVAVIDPGPDDPAHVSAILRALAGERVSHILVTHTHIDHSPAAAALKNATGALVVGCGLHRPSRPLVEGEINPLEGSGDRLYSPDAIMADGDAVAGPGWTLAAVATPGHTANHLAFDLREENALFSGDHVMAWSTSFVGPPDGAMAPYMASLEKVRDLGHAVFWPGHGGPVGDPQRFVRALISHRRFRESMILDRLREGDRGIEAIVEKVYPGLAPGLRRAAALNVFAHLEDLVAREAARVDGPLALDAVFLPA
ncbi:MAG: MBL fold metallo-hydrolase [Microvirga sp.]|nr:MBL fold metallo-hydrolase [Microvirga sp.]